MRRGADAFETMPRCIRSGDKNKFRFNARMHASQFVSRLTDSRLVCTAHRNPATGRANAHFYCRTVNVRTMRVESPENELIYRAGIVERNS